MKKSIGDNLFPKNMTFEQGLRLLKSAGYEGVELWLGDRPWFQMETSDADLRRLRDQIFGEGLQVSNISNALDWRDNVSSREPAKRQRAFDHIRRQIATAKIFECDAILVVAGIVTSDTPYNEVYKRTVDALQQLGEDAAKAKVRIGAENCCSEQKFLLSAREFQLFLADVASPSVGIHLDVGNIHDTGFAEQWVEMMGPHITRVHMKDVYKHRGRCGEQSVYTNIFLGDNDWRAIRDAMTKVGYDGWLVAEMEAPYRYAPDQQFYDTAAAMKRFISGNL